MEPFLKWAGGKRQLLGELKARMPQKYDTYYEPFVGAGALWLDLQPEKAVVNDMNMQLVNCFHTIKENTEKLLEYIQTYDAMTCDKKVYEKMKDLYNNKIINQELDVETAALMIWLNKHCFNGLYRTNKRGLFNVPYNNRSVKRSIDEENMRYISEYLNKGKITICCGDFEDICSNCKAGDFIFFDSPYIPVSDTAGFVNYTKDGFQKIDHERLAKLYRELDERGCYCMLTNSRVEWVYELYKGFQIEEVAVKRAINRDSTRRTGQDVIITNYMQ